uniref:Ycf34 n=1 Tax=Sphondylothamnion multifidum TaxID=193186 RepID=A0A4D6WZD5_9FLOR|nr:hypothetical protein [Sphondylothamnion multifidum]
MCICINCRHIHKCLTYEFIKKQHEIQILSNLTYTNFIPNNNIIQVNIKTKYMSNKMILDWDLKECSSFIEKPGAWLFFK